MGYVPKASENGKPVPLQEAVGCRQHPAGTDQHSSTQEPLSGRPPVLDKDGSLPRV